jgi:hypothetical protein
MSSWARASSQLGREPADPASECRGGEGQNRTADTAVFSRVLCQLSYLAWTPPLGAYRFAT